MKHTILKALLLSAALALFLCGSTMAVGIKPTDAESGKFGPVDVFDGKVTMTPQTAAKAAATYGYKDGVTADSGIHSGYYNAERVAVTYTGAQEGEYLLVVMEHSSGVSLADGTSPAPTKDNIVYIDQMTATDGAELSFNIYPSRLQADKTYGVYLASSAADTNLDSGSGSLTLLGEYTGYNTDPYKLGDVNEDGEVKVGDATLLLRYLAGFEELSERQLSAADTTQDGNVLVGDATLLIRYLAGLADLT